MPTTKPGEYLVVDRKGSLVNCGEAAHRTFFPGTVWVKVPGTQQATVFEMTQETKDGIPLRFKGQAVYRVVRPELTAGLFDFAADGEGALAALVTQCCLGELRDLVSRLTMAECIEQRKTALTEGVKGALESLFRGGEAGWGLDIEVVQVAQVYIVDQNLRSKLEAETRNQIQVRSDRSEIQAAELSALAQIASDRRIQEESLASERQRAALEEEKVALAAALARRQAEEDWATAQRKLEIDRLALDLEAPFLARRHELKMEPLVDLLAEGLKPLP